MYVLVQYGEVLYKHLRTNAFQYTIIKINETRIQKLFVFNNAL